MWRNRYPLCRRYGLLRRDARVLELPRTMTRCVRAAIYTQRTTANRHRCSIVLQIDQIGIGLSHIRDDCFIGQARIVVPRYEELVRVRLLAQPFQSIFEFIEASGLRQVTCMNEDIAFG